MKFRPFVTELNSLVLRVIASHGEEYLAQPDELVGHMNSLARCLFSNVRAAPLRDIPDGTTLYVDEGWTLAEVEKNYILSVLGRCGGNKMKTAAALGMSYSTFNRRLKEYGIVGGY